MEHCAVVREPVSEEPAPELGSAPEEELNGLGGMGGMCPGSGSDASRALPTSPSCILTDF